MKKFATVLVVMLLVGCGSVQQVSKPDAASQNWQYPVTQTVDVTDTYFGHEVADPYRWLEDDLSDDTAAWVKAQNVVTQGYLKNIPYRDQIKDRLTAMWNYEKVTAPFTEGGYTYFYKNDGLQNQYVVYRKKGDGEAEVFLDPNTFSEDGTVSLAQLSFSENGQLAAYSISEGGSDWRKIRIIDVESKEQIEDTLVDIKFSGISWYKNEGFYYSSYDKPKGSELSAKTDQHKLYYHQLGTPQSEDAVIYGGTEAEKHRYVGAGVSEDNRFLFISAAESTNGNKLFMKDLSDPESEVVTVLSHNDSNTSPFHSIGSQIFMVTDLDAPNKRVVTFDARKPAPEHWKDVIPETEHVLTASHGGGYFFAKYMVDAVSQVKQFDYQGQLIKTIELPGVGSASGFSGKEKDEVLYFSFSNYVTPGSIYAYNPKSQESSLYSQPNVAFDSSAYESKQVFYQSKDGTRVPMIITHKKGMKMNGQNPAMLYGYGGFNVSLTPRFSITTAAWLELGGVYAVANLRGGGEYGKDWHIAGTQMQKQNVFDDFIAAGEYLIENDYTNSDHLAIRGGSNGGLLVGAVMTQRPELVDVALPAVGVLDMLRYHTFTSGAGWAYDYGTSEQSEAMFQYLLDYSPLHNIEAGVDYPATLVTTGDHDDRVVPAHSFKFAATLQAKGSDANPLLIRIETDAGHGAGTPVSKTIEQYADIYAFTLWNFGIRSL